MTLKQRLAIVLASMGGVGFAPVASGTAGTLITMPLFWFLVAPLGYGLRGVVVGVVFGVGVWATAVAQAWWNESDSSKVVIDETAGYLLTMLPFAAEPGPVLAGFGLFRLFDIVKPFPCRQIDRGVDHPFGVMLDDMVAGVYGCLALFAIDQGMAAAGLSLWGLGV